MVIIDEMEQLFRSASAEMRAVIGEIEVMVGTTGGRTSVIACTSSSLTYSLVKGGSNLLVHDALAGAFPMLTAHDRLPDMNGDKLDRVPLPADPPVSAAVVSGFVVPTATEADKRIASFAYGNNARAMFEAATKPLAVTDPVTQLRAVGRSTLPDHTRPFCTTFPETELVCERLYDRFLAIAGNKAIFDSLAAGPPARASVTPASGGSGVTTTPARSAQLESISALAVGSVDWAQFRPLSQDDVRDVLASVLDFDRIESDGTVILDFLHYDAAFIVMVVHGDESVFDVYPASMAMLYMHMHARGEPLAAPPAHQ